VKTDEDVLSVSRFDFLSSQKESPVSIFGLEDAKNFGKGAFLATSLLGA
jgi:hypothetical protein